MSVRAVAMLVAIGPVCWAATSPAFAQSALERLERQIRQRVGTPETAEPRADTRPVAPATDTRRTGGKTEPGYLGLVADDQNDRGRGVRILDVRRGSPAEKAGLRRRDLITAVAGVRVRQMSDMSEILDTFGPGQGLDFDVLRDGQPQKVKVVLGQRLAGADQRPELPETVPLPPGQAIPKPPEPQPAGPQLEPPKIIDPRRPEAARIEQLERRMDELERRIGGLEQALKKQ
jgi:hypothetical protein